MHLIPLIILPKYTVILDRVTLDRDGIIHLNLIDFLLDNKKLCQ